MCVLVHNSKTRRGKLRDSLLSLPEVKNSRKDFKRISAEFNPDEERDSHGRWTKDGDVDTRTAHVDSNGHYYPDRQALHEALIAKYEHKPMQRNPVITVLSGGAASGKTTSAAKEFEALRSPAVVNVDILRANLPEADSLRGTPKYGMLTQEESSDIRDKILLSALGHNNDIALDAVGSKDLAGKLDKLQSAGYRVNVVYVHRPTSESIELADRRAKFSTNPDDRGRVIKPEIIAASHSKARDALPAMMANKNITIYDGTEHTDKSKPTPIIYQRVDGKVLVKDNARLERMRTSESPTIPDIF